MEVRENLEKSETEEDQHIEDEEMQPKKEKFQTEKDKVQGIYLIKIKILLNSHQNIPNYRKNPRSKRLYYQCFM